MCNLQPIAAISASALLALSGGYSVLGFFLAGRDRNRAAAAMFGVTAGFLFGVFAELVTC